MSARTVALAPARASLIDYVALTKPRIIGLLAFTGACGILAGAAGHPDLGALAAVVGGGTLCAGGANAINCALEGDLDRLMERTRDRPVAAGRISGLAATSLGVTLNLVAAMWLAMTANALAAVLAVGGTLWYVVVYTMWLKRRSPQNIVVGGLAGCFPPLVGWAAATGRVDATALALAAVIFFWTPPHFWALATLLRDDYERAHVPMLPVVASAEVTARSMFAYAAATSAVSLLPVLWGGLGLVYLTATVVLSGNLLRLTARFRREPGRPAARALFGYSLIYLAAVYAAAVLDRVLIR
ncbi:MAG: heme o synthase [Actinomycetota bacterium]|nr:heme o synthase [Actinomycetota bacterium]